MYCLQILHVHIGNFHFAESEEAEKPQVTQRWRIDPWPMAPKTAAKAEAKPKAKADAKAKGKAKVRFEHFFLEDSVSPL